MGIVGVEVIVFAEVLESNKFRLNSCDSGAHNLKLDPGLFLTYHVDVLVKLQTTNAYF